MTGGDEWVSATALRNFMLVDPLLDWLARYGAERGFIRDDRLPGYDPRTDFTQFLFAKAAEFESAVVAHLAQTAQLVSLDRRRNPPEPAGRAARGVAAPPGAPNISAQLGAAIETTLAAMQQGVEVIYHGLVLDAESRTFGEPDLLVRSDVLRRLFPEEVEHEEAAVGAPIPGNRTWHYRVVDIKFTTVRLTGGGWLASGGSAAAYRAQVFAYNRALGRMQGYEPPKGYVLGRSWQQGVGDKIVRGTGSLERLGPVNQADEKLAHQVQAASSWLRHLRTEGAAWTVFPRPTVPELWPNLGHTQDSPWHHAKREIAEQLDDLTLVWGVGAPGRARAHQAGVYSWRDPACTPELVGLHGAKKASTLIAILEVNQPLAGPGVQPSQIEAAQGEWREVAPLEFYVDFETVGDLNDDFASVATRSGEPLIFLIGCGHLENGEWQFASFVAGALTSEGEAAIIDRWFAHMESVRQRLTPEGARPRVIHWSPAEESTLETAYNSAARRHPEHTWSTPRWFDFLNRVVRAEPVVVRGALSFGLKPIARAFYDLGFIDTRWDDDGIADGLSAAAGAWWCDAEARKLGVRLAEIPLMLDIARYNEIDCKVMMEIVRYLREHH